MAGQKMGDFPLDVRPSGHRDDDLAGWVVALLVLVVLALLLSGRLTDLLAVVERGLV